MRKILSSVLMLVTGMVLLNSCEKVDVPQDVNTLGKGSYVTLEKTNNLILDFSNLAGSKASIDVAQYGADQEKLTIYVAPGTPTTVPHSSRGRECEARFASRSETRRRDICRQAKPLDGKRSRTGSRALHGDRFGDRTS